MADGPMLLVEGLRKRYGSSEREAVAGIDLEVARGELFGLLGPNGAGKTTTIGVLTTRVRPTGGRALVDGIDVVRDPVGVKQRIAVVPQRPNLDRSLSAIENLTFHAAYFGFPRRERRRRALDVLGRVGLEDRAGDQVDKYSGGMAQRLMIARALMHDPVLLVLDEPTTGLDPQSRLFLWDVMEDLRARGTTLLLTTHDMAEADRLCDRIAIVDHGEVIAQDTPRGLRSLLPGAEGTEVRLRGGSDPSERLRRIDGADRVDAVEEEGTWRVRVYGSEELTGAIVAAVRDGGGELVELRRLEGSLEDVFVHLTGRALR